MSFDDLTATMDSQVLARLGDAVVYRRASAPTVAIPINAFVDHRDAVEGFVGSAAVTQKIEIRVRVLDVAEPARDDTIELPKREETVKVISWLRDASGSWWVLDVARAV